MHKNIIALGIMAALVMPAMAYAENESVPVLESAADADSWKTLLENKAVRIQSSSFVPGTISLQSEANTQLDEVVAFADKYPDAKLEIIGFSNSKTNPVLSLGLADTIRNYLVAHGVAGKRITVKGESYNDAVGDIQTKNGRAKIRYVEILAAINGEVKEAAAESPIPVTSVPALAIAVKPALEAKPELEVEPEPVPVTPAPALEPKSEPKPAPPAPVLASVADADSWKTLLENKPVRIERTSFAPGTIKLQPQASPLLDEVAAFADEYPDAKLEIIGYAKSTTNPALAIGLADTVSNYLVAHGVVENNLTVKGESAGYPAGDKQDRNDRFVEIYLASQEKNNEAVEQEAIVPAPEPVVSVPIPVAIPVPPVTALVPVPEPKSPPVPVLQPVADAASWKMLLENKPIIIEGDNFDRYSEMLRPQTIPQLDEVVAFANKYPTRKLNITGYAISPNRARSLGLAESVMGYLLQNGVARNRIVIKGEKIDWPFDVRQTKDNRAKYRRAEILLFDNAEKKTTGKSQVQAWAPGSAVATPKSTASAAESQSLVASVLPNATVFGQVNASYDIINTGSTKGSGFSPGISANRISSNNSRLGIKGKNDIAKGLDLIWQIELTVGSDTGASGGQGSDVGTTKPFRLKRLFDRDTFVGMAGSGWGKLLVGRHDTPYKLSTRKLDIFADGIADNRSLMGTTMLGEAPATVVVETFDARLSNQIVYFSPKFGGYSLVVGYANLSENINNAAQPAVNAVSLAGMYESSNVYTSLAYEAHTTMLQDGRSVGIRAAKLGIGYKLSFFDFGLIYEQSMDDFCNVDPYIALTDPFNPYDPLANPCGDMNDGANCSGHGTAYLSMKINFTSKDALKLAYTKAGQVGAADSATGAYQFAIGFDHNINELTTIYCLYTALNNDSLVRYGLSNAATSGGANSVNQSGVGGATPTAISIGVRHSF